MEKRDFLESSGYLRPNTSLEVTPVKRYDRRRKTGIFVVDAANKNRRGVLDAQKAEKLANEVAAEAIKAKELAEEALRVAVAEKEKAISEGLTDPLTGCYNRRYFDKYVETKLDPTRLTQNVGFVFVDIDDLKAINDSKGHAAGDRAIIRTAEHIRKNLRKGDELAKFGGDEFVIISHLHESDGVVNDACLCELMETRLKTESPLDFDFSIGCAIFDHRSGGDIQEAIELADQRMYDQKKQKKLDAMGPAVMKA